APSGPAPGASSREADSLRGAGTEVGALTGGKRSRGCREGGADPAPLRRPRVDRRLGRRRRRTLPGQVEQRGGGIGLPEEFDRALKGPVPGGRMQELSVL